MGSLSFPKFAKFNPEGYVTLAKRTPPVVEEELECSGQVKRKLKF
jgi:hypothetical protein